jgi:translation initiation factor 1A
MPNKKGGKKYKSQKKKFDDGPRNTILKEDGQSYGLVTDVLGNCRFRCTLDNGNKVLAILAGRLRKRRVWIKKNDLVLVGLRDFEQDKVDIIAKYDSSEHEYLKNTESCLDILLKDVNNDQVDDGDVEFDDVAQFESDQENSDDDGDVSDDSLDIDNL